MPKCKKRLILCKKVEWLKRIQYNVINRSVRERGNYMEQNLTIRILDEIDEGIIYLNADKEIVFFNEKAKAITGISLKSERHHPSGKLEKGDIVILMTNRFGLDDGPLTKAALKTIGCEIPELNQKEALIAVGIYGHPQINGIHKIWSQSELLDLLELKVKFLGNQIHCKIDQVETMMSIQINSDTFEQKYAKAYGHMVIVNGETGQIKFFQDKGYTIRKESILEILEGGNFRPKGSKENGIEVEGMLLSNFFESEQLFKALEHIDENEGLSPNSFFLDVNHRPMNCRLTPLFKETHLEGILIKLSDLSEMSGLLTERNELLKSIEALKAQSNLSTDQEALEKFSDFIGNSSNIRNIKYLANRATEIKSNVLITGESGTGKTYLARLIHEHSLLMGDFVEVNCAAIPHSLFESELFGYERGAFTGADRRGKKGYFEMADQGTLFLDEIGEIPLEIQVKLLQVLQSKRFYKIGSSVPITANVRVITATNRSLYEAVQEGRFREDLYYRINVFPIHMPSLAERREDLYLIINDLMKKISVRLDIKEKPLSGEAFSRLLNHPWKGNIRELENVLERALAISKTNIIYPEHISMLAHETKRVEDEQNLKLRLEAFESQILKETIQHAENNREAMMQLGLSKSTFYDKLKKYHLESEFES